MSRSIRQDGHIAPIADGIQGQNPATGQLPFSGIGRLLPIDTAALYLGVSRATVERLVHRGELPIVKVGGSTRYDVEDLDRYIDMNRRRNRRLRS